MRFNGISGLCRESGSIYIGPESVESFIMSDVARRETNRGYGWNRRDDANTHLRRLASVLLTPTTFMYCSRFEAKPSVRTDLIIRIWGLELMDRGQ